MTRKSKRELERAVEALGDDDTDPSAIVFARQTGGGVWVDQDGTPLEEREYSLCFRLTSPEEGKNVAKE